MNDRERARIDNWMMQWGFHNEWITVGAHRVHINVRDGFPAEFEREVARSAVEVLDVHCRAARVVSVFNDDTHGSVCVRIGTDEEASIGECERLIYSRLEGRFPGHGFVVDVNVVKPDPRKSYSDHYDHMQYLSRKVLNWNYRFDV